LVKWKPDEAARRPLSSGGLSPGVPVSLNLTLTPTSSELTVAQTFYVFNLTRQSFLSLGVNPADTHMARLRGLLGRMRLRSDEGLWVIPCQGIHTFGVLFPIDVIYLDEKLRVIHLIEHLGPFRVTPLRRHAGSVLELPTRTIYSSNTQVGDELMIKSPEGMEAYWRTQQAALGLQSK
jgi:uncharacterized membrane protein (UPF0127 family)